MKSQVIAFDENTITLRASARKEIGKKINLEVKLPKGILIKSFLVNGTIVCCDPDQCEEQGGFLLKVKIGKLSPLNEKILDAYKDYLGREKMIKEIRVDLQAFQEAFERFGKKLRLLRQTAEDVKNNVRGTLELMKRNTENKNTTIH